MFNFNVVITGSTSGIGLGIARVFAQQKSNIIINGFCDQSEYEKIKSELLSLGAENILYSGDDISKALNCKK